MAAPSPTARSTPGGLKLEDGFSSKVTFSRDVDICLWEIDVTPPGVDNGEPISTTTMHNVRYRTKKPRKLIESTDPSFNAAYDPAIYPLIIDMIGIEQTITFTFPDGSTLAVFGYVKSFTPGALTEGGFPSAAVALVETDQDHANDVEAGPALASVSGT